jgi:serine/threonine-protein kinase HipA
LNPVPTEVKPRVLSTAIDLEDATASLGLAYDVAAYFELTPTEARQIAGRVAKATATWRKEAARVGLREAEIDRMASAFEHEDLSAALGRRRS